MRLKKAHSKEGRSATVKESNKRIASGQTVLQDYFELESESEKGSESTMHGIGLPNVADRNMDILQEISWKRKERKGIGREGGMRMAWAG